MNVLNEGRSRRSDPLAVGSCLFVTVALWVVLFVVGYLVWSVVS